MALTEVLEIISLELDSNLLLGFSIDLPERERKNESYTISFGGWVVGRNSRAVRIEVLSELAQIRMEPAWESWSLQNIPVMVDRPDLTAIYPHLQSAANCGFWTTIGVIGLPPRFELALEAILEDGTRVPIGSIRGQHLPIRTPFNVSTQPLLVTSLGRTGTTWLMHLLSYHKAVTTYKAYPYEVKMASYWLQVLRVLSQPADYERSTGYSDFTDSLSWVGHNPFFAPPLTDSLALRNWFGSDQVATLASFCQQNIDSFYSQLGDKNSSGEPRYFAEKSNPDFVPWLMAELYPQGKEIILVRDFRDMACSILSFNAKRNSTGFRRDETETTANYIHKLRIYALHLLTSWKARKASSLLVRYEDLICEPEKALTRIHEYLGVENSDASQTLIDATASSLEFRSHVTSRNPAQSIGRWMNELDEEMKLACAEAFNDCLQEFGYEVDEYYLGVHSVVAANVPTGADVLMVSRGDSRLLQLGARKTRHFPSDDSGEWLGYHPSEDWLNSHLVKLQEKGSEYLVIPEAAFWWFDYYEKFFSSLEADHQRIVSTDCCVIFKLLNHS